MCVIILRIFFAQNNCNYICGIENVVLLLKQIYFLKQKSPVARPDFLDERKYIIQHFVRRRVWTSFSLYHIWYMALSSSQQHWVAEDLSLFYVRQQI